MKKFQENIVPSNNQNAASFYKYGSGNELKILFIGNSITKHRPKPEIGWTNDCGMAASEASKDYVHQLITLISKIKTNVSYAILPIANFERDIVNFDIEKNFDEAKKYAADIIIMFFGTNVNKEYLENTEPFRIAYRNLRNYFYNAEKTKIFHVTCFYHRPQLDMQKKKVADEFGDFFIDISDISNKEETHGQFNHPSDLGMKEIAELLFEKIKKYIS